MCRFFLVYFTDDADETGETDPNKDTLSSSRSNSPSSQHSSEGAPTMVTPTTTTSILTTLHRDRNNTQKDSNSLHHHHHRRINASASPQPILPLAATHKTLQSNASSSSNRRTSLQLIDSSQDDIEHNIPATLIQDPSIER